MRWKASRMKYAMSGSTMHDTAHVHMCSDEMTGRHFRPTISSTASTPTPACTANFLTATRLTDDVAAHFHAVQRGGLQEAQGDERVNLADEALREGGDELHGRCHHDDASPAEPAQNKLCDGSTVITPNAPVSQTSEKQETGALRHQKDRLTDGSQPEAVAHELHLKPHIW